MYSSLGRLIHSKNGHLSSQPYGLFGECINSVDRKLMNEILLSVAEKSPKVSLFFEWGVERIDFDNGKVYLSK
jgi:kynurenine 3-monooxygenase